MEKDVHITQTECQLRCGAYKEELSSIFEELRRIDREVTEALRWQAEHDGRVNAWWEQQFRMNKDYDHRLRTLERKVIWTSGLMAGIGAVSGSIITKILMHIG